MTTHFDPRMPDVIYKQALRDRYWMAVMDVAVVALRAERHVAEVESMDWLERYWHLLTGHRSRQS